MTRGKPHLHLLLTASALCNDAHLQHEGERRNVVGDTTEGALLVMALKAGLAREDLETQQPRQAELPFSSERSRMTTVHPDEGGFVAYVKGGVDVLLPHCTRKQEVDSVRELTAADLDAINAANQQLASNGLRVLLIGYRRLPQMPPTDRLEEEITFLGLVGMRDPPRPEVRDAVALCYRAGIVVMIAGDKDPPRRDLGIARDTAVTARS
jgi:Ca2+-transporting ATPase